MAAFSWRLRISQLLRRPPLRLAGQLLSAHVALQRPASIGPWCSLGAGYHCTICSFKAAALILQATEIDLRRLMAAEQFTAEQSAAEEPLLSSQKPQAISDSALRTTAPSWSCVPGPAGRQMVTLPQIKAMQVSHEKQSSSHIRLRGEHPADQF